MTRQSNVIFDKFLSGGTVNMTPLYRTKTGFLALLSAIVFVCIAPTANARDRDPTPVEDAALQKADAALKVKDYAAVRGILQSPDLAQFAPAHYTLYQLHRQGLGGAKDEVAARNSLRRAAELGESRSIMILAETLERDGQPATRAEAKSWFTVAANMGQDHARAHLGLMYTEDGDDSAAFAQWSRAAADDSFARACLAMVYATGKGAPADRLMADHHFSKMFGPPNEGSNCLEKAAQAGNAMAQKTLAGWLLDKSLPNYDPVKAVQLLSSASDLGNARAAEQLAKILDKGEIVPRDPAGAVKHYVRVVASGESMYETPLNVRLGEMYLKGDGVPRDVAEAVRYFSKEEYGDHQYQLGLIYAGAEGWPADLTKAIQAMQRVGTENEGAAHKWLKQQADAGNVHAQYAYFSEMEFARPQTDATGRRLSYEEQEAAAKRNRELATTYLRMAAKQKLPKAMFEYSKSGYVESDAEKLRLVRAAADAGDTEAMLELALWHKMGWVGLAKDQNQVLAWEDRAARSGDKFALMALGQSYGTTAALASNALASNPARLAEVQQLYGKAVRYYEAAFAAGYEEAAGQLAYIYGNTQISGVGNLQLMFKWRKAALGDRPSQDEMEALSNLYESGRGTPVDLLKAWFWAKSAQRFGTAPTAKADALWQRLTAAQRVTGERQIIACELSAYRKCSI